MRAQARWDMMGPPEYYEIEDECEICERSFDVRDLTNGVCEDCE